MTSYPLVYVAPDAGDLLAACAARLERLRDEGFSVCVATPYSPALDEFAARGFEVRPLPGRDRWNVAGQLGAYPILQAHFLENRPALVHGFGTPWAWTAAYAAKQAGVPAIFATVEHHDLSHPLRVRAYRKLASWVDGYIVHHEADLETALARNIASRQQAELLLGGHGIELGAFVPDDETLEPVARPANARVVLAARRSPALTELKRAIARLHPQVGWIEVKGPVDAGLLAATDVFVSVDPRDARGVDLMAAAAMKVSVVAVDSPAARTVVVDEQTGRVVRAPGDMASVLSEVLGDPKRYTDMGIRARARAEQRFDRRQIDEQLLTVYDRILSARNP